MDIELHASTFLISLIVVGLFALACITLATRGLK